MPVGSVLTGVVAVPISVPASFLRLECKALFPVERITVPWSSVGKAGAVSSNCAVMFAPPLWNVPLCPCLCGKL